MSNNIIFTTYFKRDLKDSSKRCSDFPDNFMIGTFMDARMLSLRVLNDKSIAIAIRIKDECQILLETVNYENRVSSTTTFDFHLIFFFIKLNLYRLINS